MVLNIPHITIFALVRLVTIMIHLMLLQLVGLYEAGTADVTDVHFVLVVDCLVGGQVAETGELFRAIRTFIASVIVVSQEVLFHIAQTLEGLTTFRAQKRLFSYEKKTVKWAIYRQWWCFVSSTAPVWTRKWSFNVLDCWKTETRTMKFLFFPTRHYYMVYYYIHTFITEIALMLHLL